MSLFDKKEIGELLSTSQIGLWKIEFEEGQPQRFYADRTMDELLGIKGSITPEERAIFHREHIAPEDMEMFLEYSDKLSTEQAEVVYRYEHPTEGEMYVRCGGMRDFSIKDKVVIKGIHQDITRTIRLEKDKANETRLAEKNIQLEQQLDIIQAFGQIYNSSYYIDLSDGTFVELGTQIAKIRKIIGRWGNATESFDEMCRKIVKPAYADSMRAFTDLSTLNERLKGKKWISEQFDSAIDGWVEGYFVACNRDKKGNCLHVIWCTRNIDESKQKEIVAHEDLVKATEKAQVANKAKTTFLFNMSHDIRTPMNAIMGFTSLIERNFDDKEACRQYVKKIKYSSDILLSLINNVLEMARIESGKSKLDETTWNVYEFIDSLTTVFESQMASKNIEFISSVDVIHKYIYCDPVKLRELFLNILSNAFKYTPEGGKISIAVTEVGSKKEGYACLETRIKDNGVGMDKDFLPHIFDEFSRERTATDSKIEGTGLGMAIVKGLVELMDGDISVESEKGKGTTFIVKIHHRIAGKEEHFREEDINFDEIDFSSKRLLLAEDNELNAEIAVEILEEAGFEVERAKDGMDCLEKVAKSKADYFDCVLMDIQMPKMNGYTSARAIRALNDTKKKNIPIIALTANAFEEDKEEAKKAGMNGHIAKPIDIKILMKTLAKILPA